MNLDLINRWREGTFAPRSDRIGGSFDAQGNVLTSTNPLNETITITRNQFGQQTSVADPLGNITVFHFVPGNFQLGSLLESITDQEDGVRHEY